MDLKLKRSFCAKTSSQNMASKMMRSISNKTPWCKQKTMTKTKTKDDKQNAKCDRFLITINVCGSTGPIRLVVNGDDNAAAVIERALKLYARQGSLPALGPDINSFFLCAANKAFDVVKPPEAIGSRGVRNFVLCKKESKPDMATEAKSQQVINHGKGSGWRAWLAPKIF